MTPLVRSLEDLEGPRRPRCLRYLWRGGRREGAGVERGKDEGGSKKGACREDESEGEKIVMGGGEEGGKGVMEGEEGWERRERLG